MIFEELYILSFSEQKILKKYTFNKIGMNVILGDAKTDSNGVGKSAMVDAIRMILGEAIPYDFKKKSELYKRDIMLVLKVNVENKIKYFARLIIDEDNGYISDSIAIDSRTWEIYDIKKYRSLLQDYMYMGMQKDGAPSFQSIREYLIRDEKRGFNDISLPQRKPLQVSQCLNLLSLLPTNYESDINKLKNEQATFENEINIIKTIAKDIGKLRSTKIKIESEISKMKTMLDSISVAEKIDYDEEKYIQAKKQLRKIESAIFKNEYSKRQFEQNIENLTEKHDKMKELVDLQGYYLQLLKYFPQDITKNYEEMEMFFDFMQKNRGDYFEERIVVIEDELARLQNEKNELQLIITSCTKIFQNTQIVDDIHNLNEQLNVEYLKLADAKMKIEKYNEINTLTKASNKKGKEIIEKTNKYEDEYNNYSNYTSNIITHFVNLVHEAYGETGELSYEYVNEVKKKSNTGRIKIICQIADENSHGRLYMKINMFDLALLLNRIDYEVGCDILIHDGSYCKPHPEAKANIINYIDRYLKQSDHGQYFITINRVELNKEDLKNIKETGMIIAEFDREHGDENRFFGFKY